MDDTMMTTPSLRCAISGSTRLHEPVVGDDVVLQDLAETRRRAARPSGRSRDWRRRCRPGCRSGPRCLRVSRDQVLELGLVADVGRHGDGFAAGRRGSPARPPRRRRALRLEITTLAPCGRQVLGDGAADAAAGAGDDGDLAGPTGMPSSPASDLRCIDSAGRINTIKCWLRCRGHFDGIYAARA